MKNENIMISLSELEGFYDQSCEDFHLWDELENGAYPNDRMLDALRKFIDSKK